MLVPAGTVERLQPLAQVERDVVARPLAFAARSQVDLEFAQFRRLAQVIVPHQSVEIERRRRAGIGLQRGDLRQLSRDLGRTEQRALGRFQARPFRQIDDDGDFGLVVERQQLDRHRLGREQRHRQQRRDADAEQEDPGRALAPNDRRGEAPVEPAEPPFPSCAAWAAATSPFGASLSISQGATTMATKNENSIAAEAFAGIGAM